MQRALPPPLLTPPSPVSLLLRKKAVCFFLGGSRSKGSLEDEAAVWGREEDACLGIALLELAERKEAGESWAALDTAGARSGCMSVICVLARSCVAVRQR
jgi:hypothetical protein